MNEKWFSLPVDEIEKKLRTNVASGLSLKAAHARASKDSAFFKVRKKNIGLLIVELFYDFFLLMLTLVSFFAIFLGDGTVGGVVLVIVLLSLGASFLLHFRNRRSIESLSALFLPTARVIRGGKLYVLDYKDVVVGDVIIVERGDVIGVDARLVYSDDLKVTMQIDKKTEKKLQKYANGAVSPEEIYAENMVNMLHAGSTVDEGSGRAVVIATGDYTYLGSVMGGLSQSLEDDIPQTLKLLRKSCSKFSMILLICLLPFCIISLLMGELVGGNSFLSQTIMIALAFGATFRLTSFSTLFAAFFNRYVRKAAVADNPCILRSASVLDKLADTDYIFILDGSIATDGILHFAALETADGALKDIESLSGSAAELFNMVTIYAQARSSMPSIGVKSYGMIDMAIEELLNKANFDREALKIRCTVNSYLPRVDRSVSDTLVYTEMGINKEMQVSTSSRIIEDCAYVYLAGEKKLLTYEGIQRLKNLFYSNVNSGKKPIIFTSVSDGARCFVGMLVLREGLDYTTVHTVNEFRKNGIGVITFSNCYDRDLAVPEIPDLLKSEKVASFVEFKRRDLSVTSEFGSYEEYNGFGADDIYKLAGLVKSEGKTLTIIGFSDYAEKAIEISDVFISCAPIKTESRGRLDEEITALEIPGEESSATCMQTVKINADALLMRPKNGKGGIEPLMRVMEYCRMAYRNLNRFLIYLFCVQITRLIAIILPMLFGVSVTDARHVALLGLCFDVFALFLFMTNSRRAGPTVKTVKKLYSEQRFRDMIKKYKNPLICAVTGGVLVLILPAIFNSFNLFDGHQYKEEFTFLALMLLQLVIVAMIYTVDITSRTALKMLFSRKLFLAEILAFVLLISLSFLITPIGDLIGLSGNFVTRSTFYFLLTVVPAIAVIVLYAVMLLTGNDDASKSKTNSDKMHRARNKNQKRKM